MVEGGEWRMEDGRLRVEGGGWEVGKEENYCWISNGVYAF